MATSRPTLTVVTPSLNQGRYLEQTLRSVLDQGGAEVESIVIDGGSTDETAEVIERFRPRLAHAVSEPDRGQADALNKGLARARGEYFAFLNSDDLYLPGALPAVLRYLAEHPDCSWLCGDTLLFGESGQGTELVSARVPRSAGHALAWAYRAPQPGMFWRRSLLTGGFDAGLRYCFDHDLYVRLLLAGQRCRHLPLPVAAYRLHETSKTVAEADGFGREFDAIAERYEPRLTAGARRWSRATRLLRRSYEASRGGRRGPALRLLLHALAIYPPEILRREYWGCAKAVLTAARP
jgi:glycosyltransferase involved in cell wall biosynthesis